MSLESPETVDELKAMVWLKAYLACLAHTDWKYRAETADQCVREYAARFIEPFIEGKSTT